MGERAVIVGVVMGAYGLPIGTPCAEGCQMPAGKKCHCSVCHETFSVVANFDKHRSGGWCMDPATVGLHVDQQGVWRSAPSEDGPLPGRRPETEGLAAPVGTPGTNRGSQGLYGAIRP